jgi:hypothetical protein
VLLRGRWIATAILHLDPTGFASHLKSWLEAMAFSTREAGAKFDAFWPLRGDIPLLARDATRGRFHSDDGR